jgi:molecular chaperone HscB
MKYYELFGLDPKLDIDEKRLKEKFFILSRSTHPDFFTLSSVDEQMEAMEKSTLINNAYKTLKEEGARIRYVLEEKGFLSNDEKEQMPMDFLMEMMEFNEKIMEAKMEQNKSTITEVSNEIDRLAQNWSAEIQDLRVKEFNIFTNDQWQVLKDFYLKQRYLRRLKQQLEGTTEL